MADAPRRMISRLGIHGKITGAILKYINGRRSGLISARRRVRTLLCEVENRTSKPTGGEQPGYEIKENGLGV